MSGILFDECSELLNGGNDDFPGLSSSSWRFRDCRGGVAVRRALLKAVVFLHRLVVQVLAVNDEKHLVDVVQLGGKLRCFEEVSVFPLPVVCQMYRGPLRCRISCAVVGDLNAVQNALGGNNLVGTHDQQQISAVNTQ